MPSLSVLMISDLETSFDVPTQRSSSKFLGTDLQMEEVDPEKLEYPSISGKESMALSLVLPRKKALSPAETNLARILASRLTVLRRKIISLNPSMWPAICSSSATDAGSP